VAGAFEFYVDGVLRTTVNASFPAATPVRVTMSSFQGAAAGVLEVDSVNVESHAASGEYLSSIFDATRAANWGSASWTASVPSGTTMIVETRSGNSPTPDGTWSSWLAVSSGGPIGSPAGRYLQYRVRFSTTAANLTPEFGEILISWL
jgi:hypothetical protein